jgi:membrane protease YdiL (CAAX protease family)
LKARDLFYTAAGALRAPWRLLVFLLVSAVAIIVIPLVLGVILRPSGQWAQQFVAFWALLIGLITSHAVMLRWVERRPWSYVGLGRSQATPQVIAAGLTAGALGIVVPSGLLLALAWLRAEPATTGGWLSFAGVMALFFLPQSLAEEMALRGYIFAVVREALGWPAALLGTSVIFGLLHLGNPGASAQSTILVVLAGLFLGGILLATGSLYAAWMAHFAWNWAMAALLHTPVSGIAVRPPDYRVVDAGPDWATGGAWGPEGGAAAALGMAGALWTLVAWRRHFQARGDGVLDRNGSMSERHD